MSKITASINDLLEEAGCGAIKLEGDMEMVLQWLPVHEDAQIECDDSEWADQLKPPFVPIIAMGSVEDPLILDGNHRYVAALRLGIPKILAWRCA